MIQVRVTGKPRFAIDAHPARPADGGAAGTANTNGPIELCLGLQDSLEHGAVRLELDGVFIPVRRLAGLGVVAAQAQGELLRRPPSVGSGGGVECGHQYFLSSGCHWVMVTG